jgi:hypothetical protein
MEKSALISGSYFAIFSIFLFYQQSFVKNFNGSSETAFSVVTYFAFGGYIAQIIYFLYYSWNVSFIEALIICVLSIVVGGIAGAIIERIIGGLVIVAISFFALPYFCYKMFTTIPII